MSISMIFIHSAEMTPKIWSKTKRIVPGKYMYKHSQITCNISVNDFNHHFANISNKMNSKFQNFDDIFSGKAQKVFIVFVSRRCPLRLLNPMVTYLVWTSFYWENQPHIFVYHWQMWQINPLSRLSLGRTGRTPEWRLSMRMMATLMTKIIIVQYLS